MGLIINHYSAQTDLLLWRIAKMFWALRACRQIAVMALKVEPLIGNNVPELESCTSVLRGSAALSEQVCEKWLFHVQEP